MNYFKCGTPKPIHSHPQQVYASLDMTGHAWQHQINISSLISLEVSSHKNAMFPW